MLTVFDLCAMDDSKTRPDSRPTGREIETLIALLAKLPGLGPRSARRAALQLIKKREALLGPLAQAMSEAARHVHPCGVCGNLDTVDPCGLCRDERRDPSLVKPEDKEMLEDLIVAAHADARAKLEERMASEMQKITGGLPLPPRFQLPVWLRLIE